MTDIATALNNIAHAIYEQKVYREVIPLTPFSMTPTVAAVPVSKAEYPTGVKVSYLSILVRSMGTATYIAIGRPGAQEERLIAVGDVWVTYAPEKCYIDTSKIMIRADVADAVVEVGGILLPEGSILK